MKITAQLGLLTILSFFMPIQLEAQCPPASSPNIHVVQKGESLWGISNKYGKTVDEIARLNNIQQHDNLYICQELIVDTRQTGNTDSGTQTQIEVKPQGTTHSIRPGETIAGIAKMYGYTEERFRRFNGLRKDETPWVGLVLKTSDCNCPKLREPSRVDVVNETINPGTEPTEPKIEETTVRPYRPDQRVTKVQVIEDTFKENPFGEEEPEMTSNIWQSNRSNPSSYQTDIDLKTINNSDYPARNRKSASKPDQRKYLPADEKLAADNRFRSNEDKPAAAADITKDAARYMKAEEIEMLREINLVRSDPAGYVKYIEEYKKKVSEGKAFGSLSTCNELIQELNRSPQLSLLLPAECIYNAAKKHGLDQRPTGDVDHVGTDNSYPWERVRRECPNMTDGNENIVAGPSSIRDAIILLLIDEGTPNRGHRRTMLDPDWVFAACYKVGRVGNMPNYWVQNFGK